MSRLAARFNDISAILLHYLWFNALLVVAMLPLLGFLLYTDRFVGLGVPVLLGLGALGGVAAVPGLAAGFAAARDAPALRAPEMVAEDLAPDPNMAVIAQPYWDEADDSRLLWPFWRSYRRLVGRGLRLGLCFAVVLGAIGSAVLGALRLPGLLGLAVTAFLLALGALGVVALLVACAMLVEFPRARSWPLVRTGWLLAAKHWPQSVGSLLLIAGASYLLFQVPLVMMTIGLGLTVFLCYQLAASTIRQTRQQLIAEVALQG